ncbi:hypothetical protein [Thermoanaerobacterium thermosaccharolyticum]|uniref:hypothetical protein n=1 Tax=Thermoanaerobacterium thermosaccharolyticum TaxID=1517 RepID=UPI003DA8BC0F
MLRGGCAVIFLIIITIAMIIDVIFGNSESFYNWAYIIVISAILKGISILINNVKKDKNHMKQNYNIDNRYICPYCNKHLKLKMV